MPKIPDRIVNKKAKSLQGWMIGIGLFLGLACFGFIQNGDGGGAFWSGLICFGLLFTASKIKTHYNYQGGSARYK